MDGDIERSVKLEDGPGASDAITQGEGKEGDGVVRTEVNEGTLKEIGTCFE